jgi:hypothetical protein
VAGFLVKLAGVLAAADDGLTEPSVSVSRNATKSSSSAEDRRSLPMVMFSLLGSSGIGSRSLSRPFPLVPGQHRLRVNVSSVVEVDYFLETE